MERTFEMVAKTYRGLEDVLVDELLSLGAQNVEAGNRMVSFTGDLETLYKANLCCRTALRILKPIIKFRAEDPDDLYDQIRELPWEQFMSVNSTFSIDSTVNSADFTHSKYVVYRVKDGICDHFYDRERRRPSIRLNDADLLLNVHIDADRVTISLDSSGEPLSHRGYRVEETQAPLSEVLAAGIILKTGWRGDSDFADPMCGSGTFLIEAALIAANINPGIFRSKFAFEKWADFDADLFERIYNDDSEEREFRCRIYGADNDPEAVRIAAANIRAAKVEDMIDLKCRDFEKWEPMTEQGVLVTNPPYGKRIKSDNILDLYRMIGSTLKHKFQGWHAWILGLEDDHFSAIGLKPSQRIPLNNGGEECMLQEYVLFDGGYSAFRSEGGTVKEKRAPKGEAKRAARLTDQEWDADSRKFNRNQGDFKAKKRSGDRYGDGGRSGGRSGGRPGRYDDGGRAGGRPGRYDDRYGDQSRDRRDINRDRREELDSDRPLPKIDYKRAANQKPRKPYRPRPEADDADEPKKQKHRGPKLSAQNEERFKTDHLRPRKPKP